MKCSSVTALLRAPVSTAALVLSACGGDGASAPPSLTGVFSDGPVDGVEYTTIGGYGGTTADGGKFLFNTGDTVTFKLGAITLGSSSASTMLTPIDISGGNANKVTNILALLQSLDADADADNGITINAATLAAAKNFSQTLDLDQYPIVFAQGGSALSALINAAGLPPGNQITDPAVALASFKTQTLKSFGGAWQIHTQSDEATVLNLDESGNYLLGQVRPADAGGRHGVEAGALDWSPLTGAVTATTLIDTNGAWGFSHSTGIGTLKRVLDLAGDKSKDKLVYKDGDGTVELARVVDQPHGLVGAWALNTASVGMPLVTFFPDGIYLMVDPMHYSDPTCDNVELGYYTYSASTGEFVVTSVDAKTPDACLTVIEDVNAPVTFAIAADGKTFSVAGGASPVVFRRVSE